MSDELAFTPVPANVLRGVPLHEVPHELVVRRRRGVPDAPPATAAVEPSRAALQEAFDAGYQRGLADGSVAGAAELKILTDSIEDERRKGFAEGHAEGERQAAQQAAGELEMLRAELESRAADSRKDERSRVEELLRTLTGLSDRVLADAEDDLVALVHEMVCRILGGSAHDPAVLGRMAASLLKDRQLEAKYSLHVHPEDLALVQAAADESARWRWVGDESVALGGMVLRTQHGSIDARLETQLRALREELLDVRRKQAKTTQESAG